MRQICEICEMISSYISNAPRLLGKNQLIADVHPIIQIELKLITNISYDRHNSSSRIRVKAICPHLISHD